MRFASILFCIALLPGLLSGCRNAGSSAAAQRSVRLDSMQALWNRLTIAGRFDSLVETTRPFFETSLRQRDTLAALSAGVCMAQSFQMLDRIDSVSRWLERIESLRYRTDPRTGIVLHTVEGNHALKSKLDYSAALESFRAGLQYAEQIDDRSNRIILLANIANIFYLRSDRNGLPYAEQAERLAADDGPEEIASFLRCVVCISMAQMLYLADDYEGARRYVQQADAIASAQHIASLRANIDLLLADLWSVADEPLKADSCYRQALAYVSVTEPAIVSLIYLRYADHCRQQGDHDRALALYGKGLDLSYRHGNMDFRRLFLDRLSALHYRTGDRKASLDYYRRLCDHLDSISNRVTEQEFNALVQRLERIGHEHALQTKQLEVLRANRNTALAVGILLPIVILAASLWLLYTRQRRMYRTLVLHYQRSVDEAKTSRRTGEGAKDQKEGARRSGGDSELFDRIEELMRCDEIFRRKGLSLQTLSEMVASNRTYVSATINACAGTSFYGYLDRYRIREATRVLAREGDATLKGLADELGYNSLPVFYKAFQKEVGVTPRQYREEIRRLRREKIQNP